MDDLSYRKETRVVVQASGRLHNNHNQRQFGYEVGSNHGSSLAEAIKAAANTALVEEDEMIIRELVQFLAK